MAEKRTINIDINNNAEEAAKDFQDFAKATNVANDSVEGLNKTFEEVYGELQPLTTRMGEAEDRLYELALAGDTTSKEYNELLKSVGNYRKVQIQTDLAVDAAATTLSQKLGGALTGATSGFAAVQGVMGLVGSESETLEKTLLKVQSALALQQGVQGVLEYSKSIGLAGKATKVFNLIVKANPLALLATTLIAIIGYFAVFTDAIDQAIDKLKSIGDFIGLTNFKEQKLEDDRKKRHKAEIERREQLKKEAEVLKGIRSAQIEQLDALGKETFKLKKAALEAAEAEAKQNFQVEKAIRIRTQIILLEKERAEKLKAQAAERKKIAEEEENRIKKLNEERIKQLDAEKAILQEGSEFLKNANFEEVDSAFNKYTAMGEISMQYYKDEDARRKEDREKVFEGIEKGLEMAEKGAAAVQALGDVVFAHKMQGLEKGSKEEEKMARKQFKFNKALQLGGAIIDAGKAITASLAQSPVAIGPVPNPAGIASLAFAAATSAANIATIASTKFESPGGTVDNPSPSGIGGGGAPEFNVVGDSGVNQLAQLQQQPTQAFVVSGEVTTAQALDRNRVQNATL